MIKECETCLMDETFPLFHKIGHECSYCQVGKARFIQAKQKPNIHEYLDTTLKSQSKYQCILGISGGVDSSYLAFKLKDLGIRALLVHVDCGWNTNLASQNIELIINQTGFDYFTMVPDWNLLKKLQISYLKSGVYNQDVPQDHAFVAGMYIAASKFKIKNMISGHSSATENIPNLWQHDAMDFSNLHSIANSYEKNLDFSSYPYLNFFQYYFWYPLIKRIKFYTPLDCLQYDKTKAINFLEKKGYVKYKDKHGESAFTKYFQNFYLPKKFGIHKIKTHLSSQIINGEISRSQAKEIFKEHLQSLKNDDHTEKYFYEKLDLSNEEYKNIMQSNSKQYYDFANWDQLKKRAQIIKSIISPNKGHRE